MTLQRPLPSNADVDTHQWSTELRHACGTMQRRRAWSWSAHRSTARCWVERTEGSFAQIPCMAMRAGSGHGVIMATSTAQLHKQVMTGQVQHELERTHKHSLAPSAPAPAHRSQPAESPTLSSTGGGAVLPVPITHHNLQYINAKPSLAWTLPSLLIRFSWGYTYKRCRLNHRAHLTHISWMDGRAESPGNTQSCAAPLQAAAVLRVSSHLALPQQP